MSCNYGCTDDIGEHEVIPCGELKYGGNPAIGILECSHSITDFTDATQLQAAITAGLLKVVKEVKAQIPEASEETIENPIGCGAENIVTNYNRTMTGTDPNVTQSNTEFWDSLKPRKSFAMLFNCSNSELTVIEVKGVWVAKKSNLNQKDIQQYSFVFSWKNYNEPPVYTLGAAAAALFEV